MTAIDEAERAIREVYASMGENPDDLVIHEGPDFTYRVARKDGREVRVPRKHIDDYLDSRDESAAESITAVLQDFE